MNTDGPLCFIPLSDWCNDCDFSSGSLDDVDDFLSFLLFLFAKM